MNGIHTSPREQPTIINLLARKVLTKKKIGRRITTRSSKVGKLSALFAGLGMAKRNDFASANIIFVLGMILPLTEQ